MRPLEGPLAGIPPADQGGGITIPVLVRWRLSPFSTPVSLTLSFSSNPHLCLFAYQRVSQGYSDLPIWAVWPFFELQELKQTLSLRCLYPKPQTNADAKPPLTPSPCSRPTRREQRLTRRMPACAALVWVLGEEKVGWGREEGRESLRGCRGSGGRLTGGISGVVGWWRESSLLGCLRRMEGVRVKEDDGGDESE